MAAGLAAYDKFDCAHCGTKVGEVRKPAVVPKLGVNIAWNPVAKDKRPKPGVVVSGRDTLTVLSAPVAFVVQLGPVKAPATTGDILSRENTWVIPIENYRPFDYLTRPGKDSLQYVTFPVNSKDLDRNFGNNAATLDRIQAVIEKVRCWYPSWALPPSTAPRTPTTPWRRLAPAPLRTISMKGRL